MLSLTLLSDRGAIDLSTSSWYRHCKLLEPNTAEPKNFNVLEPKPLLQFEIIVRPAAEDTDSGQLSDKPSENEMNRTNLLTRCVGDHPHTKVMDQLERHRIVLQELDFQAMKVDFLKDNTLDFIRSSSDCHIFGDDSVSNSDLTDCLQTQVNWC